MSLHRIDAKRDANEPAIVAALKKHGAQVWRLSEPGVPDLLCALQRRFFLVEVKVGSARLTAAQRVFFADAAHHDRPAFVCRNPDDVQLAVATVRLWDEVESYGGSDE